VRVTFRVGLVAALVGLLVLTVVVIFVPSSQSVHKAATSLSVEVLAQAIGRVDSRLESQLDVAEDEDREDLLLSTHGQLPMDNLDAVGAYLLDALSAHPELSYLSLAVDKTGEAVTSQRTQGGALALHILREHDGGKLALEDYEFRGGKLTLAHRDDDRPGNDPRTRPYYKFAQTSRVPTWTESTEFVSTGGARGARGVSHVTPLRRADGSLAGALTADFSLGAISQFLKSLQILAHGTAYVVEYRDDGSRRILARGTDDAAQGGQEERLETAVLAALPRVLPHGETTATPVRFELPSGAYMGAFRPIERPGLHWAVVAVVPEDDVLGEVKKTDTIVLGIITVSLTVAVLLALLLAGAIARPLQALASDAEAVGRFELDSRPVAASWIREVATLATAMEEMKRGLRAFKKFVPADLVRDILASEKDAGTSGKRATLTIHFSDIAGFTSIAESLPAEELVSILGLYLQEMTTPIVKSGGTVDKYIGDAVMAFWGAPRPDPEHAVHACEAALYNLRRLDTLNETWELEGKPRLDARVGLHTGEAVVGNIGGDARLNYTIIGDAVNLASRLEGLNKEYGTRLVISDATYALVERMMVARPIDKVAVKGKAKGVVVYELIGTKSDATSAQKIVAERHAEAFALYLERKWPEAVAILRERLGVAPKDKAAKVLLERCEGFMASPPPEDWDGTTHMTTK
jgi:adenylate cyclase